MNTNNLTAKKIFTSNIDRSSDLLGRWAYVANGQDVDPSEMVYVPKGISLLFQVEIQAEMPDFFTHLSALALAKVFPLAQITTPGEFPGTWTADWSGYQSAFEALSAIEERSNERRHRHDAQTVSAAREIYFTGQSDWQDMPADETSEMILDQSWQ
jgi:hypothetical protein